MINSTISRGKSHRNTDKIKNFYSAQKLIDYPRKALKNRIPHIHTVYQSNNTQGESICNSIYHFISYNFSTTPVSLHLCFSNTPNYYHLPNFITSLSCFHTEQLVVVPACQTTHNLAESSIKNYFFLQPSSRAQLREKYALDIKSNKNVFSVLEFGNTGSFIDSYDAAVDILAECDKNVLINAIEFARENYISYENLEVAKSWEKNWEILIKALSCALKIEPYRKMTLLLLLCDRRNKLSRLIKLALIDAIIDIDIDKELAMVMLKIFMSERESDNFVRNYAYEQAEECL